MENRYQVAFSAALLAALWAGLADAFELVTWIGFVGCSIFFAQPKPGFQGVIMTWATSISGVFWAWGIITAGAYFSSPFLGYLFTAIGTGAMCIQSGYHRLSFIPGAFIGCCVTFALAGDIAQVLPSLFLGAPLGYSMALLTRFLINLTPSSQGLPQGE